MNKYSGIATCRQAKPPFADLVAPANDLAEALLAIFSDLGNALIGRIRRWRNEAKIARTAAELSRLEDRMLDDIGIRREDIYLAARASVETPDADIPHGNYRHG